MPHRRRTPGPLPAGAVRGDRGRLQQGAASRSSACWVRNFSGSFGLALARLTGSRSIVLDYYKKSPSLFERLQRREFNTADEAEASALFFVCLAVPSPAHIGPQTARLIELSKTALRFLRFRPVEFSQVWNWSLFFSLITHPNDRLRWYAQQCVATLVGVSDARKQQLGLLALESRAASPANIDEAQRCVSVHLSRGRVLPASVFREAEEAALEEAILLSGEPLANTADGPATKTVTSAHLSEALVDVCGVLLRKVTREMEQQPTVVAVVNVIPDPP